MIVCYWGKAPQLRDSVSIGAILQLNVAHWTGFTTWTMDNELTHVSLSCFIWVKWWAVLFKLIIKHRWGDQVTRCTRNELWQIKTSRCGQGSKYAGHHVNTIWSGHGMSMRVLCLIKPVMSAMPGVLNSRLNWKIWVHSFYISDV